MAFPPRPPRGAFNPRFKKEQQQEHRTNYMIKVPEVRLVGENIEPGIYPTPDALKIAQSQELDLVEISPGANPPVCKVIDYNKFLYEEKKKKKEVCSHKQHINCLKRQKTFTLLVMLKVVICLTTKQM